MNKSKGITFFQKLGKVLMTPILILPVVGIMVGFASSLTSANMIRILPFISNQYVMLILNIIKNVGNIVVNNLAVLFAICTAYGYAKSEKGVAALNGFIAFMIMNVVMGTILTSTGALIPGQLTNGQASVLGILTLNTGVFGGILAGGLVSYLHNKYYKIQLPQAFSFFNGTRFIPVVAIPATIILGIILTLVFPPIQSALDSLAILIRDTGALGAFIYGLSERLLLPFGMHLLFIVPLLVSPLGGSMVVGGALVEGPVNVYNAILNTPDAMFDVDISRFVMNGKIILALFGYTAIAYATYKTSYFKNRKKTKALMIATALPCILTGISEPLEFSFLFISPLLYLFHSFMAGLAYFLSYIVGFNVAGTTAFGGPILSMIFNGVLQADKGSNWYWAFIIGIPYFFIYYFVFKKVILAKNIKTIGREDDADDEENTLHNEHEIVSCIILALGGKENIISVDACFTRLRVAVKEVSLIKEDDYFNKELNASGVVRIGNGVQIIYGPKAELYKTEINELLD